MHPEARAFVAKTVWHAGPFTNVLEFGSRNVNGTVRGLFGSPERYVGVDIEPGPGVDLVCDAADWQGDGFDAVVCCEVLEHTPYGGSILEAARRALLPGGHLILTCATDRRAPHSAVDGGDLRADEHYANVTAGALTGWLAAAGFAAPTLEVHEARGDLYCVTTAA